MINHDDYTPSLHQPAPHPVECALSPTGKHAPRTLESISTINGQDVHMKTSVCHYCNSVA